MLGAKKIVSLLGRFPDFRYSNRFENTPHFIRSVIACPGNTSNTIERKADISLSIRPNSSFEKLEIKKKQKERV